MRTPTILKTALLILSTSQLSACVVFLPLLETDYVPAHRASCPLTGEISAYRNQDSSLQPGVVAKEVSKPQRSTVPHPTASAYKTNPETSNRTIRVIVRKRTAFASSGRNRIESLISQLGHADDVVRTHAATDLGMLGAKAQRAVTPLSNALERDKSKWVRRAAVKALAKIGTPEVLRPLTLALNDRNKYVAHSAKQALRRLKLILSARASRQVVSM